MPRLLTVGAIAYAESIASDAASGPANEILSEFSRRLILAGAIQIVANKLKRNGRNADLLVFGRELKDELLNK